MSILEEEGLEKEEERKEGGRRQYFPLPACRETLSAFCLPWR